MMAKAVLAVFLLLATEASADKVSVPNEDMQNATSVSFLMDRFIGSNPLYGRNQDAKAPFEWSNSFLVSLISLRATIDDAPRETAREVEQYLQAFGPVAVPSVLPNLALCQSDKATCPETLGAPHEQTNR